MSELPASHHEKILNKLASLSYRTGELQPYLDNICAAVLEVLGDGAAAITLYRAGKKNVIARVPPSNKIGVPLDIHGHLSTYVVDRGVTLRVSDAQTTPEYGKAPAGFCSYLGIPLKLPSGEVVGTLCYFNKAPRNYTDQDQQVAEIFAERVAVALDNFNMYQQLKQHRDDLEQQVQQRTHELLAARDALAQKEKLAAIGEFATKLTHEIRNPLATIRLVLEYVEQHGDERASKRASLAASEVSRLERMLNETLQYARPATLAPSPLPLANFLQQFIQANQERLQSRQQQFSLTIISEPTVQADQDKLTQICLNLARNASDAAGNNAVLDWAIGRSDDYGFIRLHNTGQTIPAEKLAHITDAFVSGKADGSGLGLAIVKSLVAAHQGHLEIHSSPQQGTQVTVFIPLVEAK